MFLNSIYAYLPFQSARSFLRISLLIANRFEIPWQHVEEFGSSKVIDLFVDRATEPSVCHMFYDDQLVLYDGLAFLYSLVVYTLWYENHNIVNLRRNS